MVVPVLVNFALVIVILYFATRKPLAQAFVTRSEQVGSLIIEAEKLSSESTALLSEWEGNWKASEAHAKALMDETKKNLERYKQSSLENTKREAERILAEGKLVGESERSKAAQALEQELAKKSIQLASQFLSSHLTEEDRKKLVKEYTEIVGNGVSE